MPEQFQFTGAYKSMIANASETAFANPVVCTSFDTLMYSSAMVIMLIAKSEPANPTLAV